MCFFLSFLSELAICVFPNRPLQTKLILCRPEKENEHEGWELDYRDSPRLPALWINCVLACEAGGSGEQEGGFIPLSAARSSAGVSDLVIRLWGRAAQRKSPLNSEEALKACSSLCRKEGRKWEKKKSFFLKKKKMQAQIQLAEAHETQGESRGLFELNPTLRCEAFSLKHVDLNFTFSVSDCDLYSVLRAKYNLCSTEKTKHSTLED